MSSYGSNMSGHSHAHHQQPPYPTTPEPAQQSPFYPPQPSTHPPNHYHPSAPQPFFASSPTTQHMVPQPRTRRSPSLSHHRSSYDQGRPSYDHAHSSSTSPSMAIPIRPPNPAEYQHHPPSSYPPYAAPPSSYPVHGPHQQTPVYTRTTSHHTHDPRAHAHTDADDTFIAHEGGRLDEATEREYERRYARNKAMERRPTLGDSLVSTLDKLGSVLGRKRE